MRRSHFFAFAFFIFIALLFFYPIFKNNIPFPGDLLIGEYTPYNSYPYFGFNPGSYPNKGQDFDVLRLIYPDKEFSIQQLRAGSIPFWNPYNFSGNPHLASFQSGTFYPINLIFFILPYINAWTIYIMLQPILAGFFTYLLLREYDMSLESSIFGGVAFAFSSFLVVWLEYGNLDHSFLWLPLVLYLLHKNLKKTTFLKSILISLVLSASILAGYIQMSIYVFIFAFLYALYVLIFIEKKNIVKNILVLILIFILPVFLTSFQLLPTIELFFESTRKSFSSNALIELLIPFKHLVTIFIPDFFGNPATRNYYLTGTYIERVSYIGIIPLFFAVYALFKKPTKIITFYFLSAFSVFIFAYDTFITRFLYSVYVPPILSTGVPSRMMFLFAFALCILASFGFNEFQINNNRKKVLGIVAIFVAIFAGIWSYAYLISKFQSNSASLSDILITRHNLIVPTLVLIFGIGCILIYTFFRESRKILLYVIIIITLGDLYFFFQKITPFAPSETLYPKTAVVSKIRQIQGINRVWGYGQGYIQANIQTHEKIYGTDGYDALHLKNYAQLITTSKNGILNFSPPRSEVIIDPGYGNSDLKSNKFRQTLLNILGVKYILNKTDGLSQKADTLTFPEDVYSLVWQKGLWQIYKNKEALPRFFLTANYVIEQNPQKTINLMMRNDMSNMIVLSTSPKNINSIKPDPHASVKLISYKPNKVIFKTSTKENMLLFLSDTYDKQWHLTIDNTYAKIYKADYAFRAALIPKGTHTIIFSYYPQSFDLGLKITGIVIVLGVLGFIVFEFKKRHV